MNKATLTGLAAIAMAAGVGCANMYYNERGLIEQEGSERLYHELTRTPETLELAVRVEDNGIVKTEIVWTRYEPANSAECIRETVHVYEKEIEDFTIIDEECNCQPDPGMIIATGADEGFGYSDRFGGDLSNEEFVRERYTWPRQEVLDYLFNCVEEHILLQFNENQQLADYHRWKGLE